ncbi:hypothetical protein EYZ11_005194 [Aspergillus tanneri]|uniref:Uncharacterized protein n=1 Tax=Aspergillus tanneri TaxID=1220188 RepID=A0A4V3UPI6_9EURO|nr:hypothetical protein EYZ11_005194 [Aspergillus tanneri]
MIWWDATLALVSRQGPILPRPYLDHLRSHETDDQWSFYQLSGCPTELVVQTKTLSMLEKIDTIASRPGGTLFSYILNVFLNGTVEYLNRKLWDV